MIQQTDQPKVRNAQAARRVVKFVLFFHGALLMTMLCEMAANGASGLVLTLFLALVVDVPIVIYASAQDVLFVWNKWKGHW